MGRFRLRPRGVKQWMEYFDYQRDKDRRNDGETSPVEPPAIDVWTPEAISNPAAVPSPDAASAAQTASSIVGTVFANSNNRYNTSLSVPAGDWTLGMWFRTTVAGTMFSAGPATSVYTSNNTLHIYSSIETLGVVGKDSAGNSLGLSATIQPNSSSRGFQSRYNLISGLAAFLCLRKTGNLIQLWLKWPGHAAVKVAEETTLFGAFGSSQGCYFGMDRSSSFRWSGAIRCPFFVSYAITDAQINQVAEGTNPTTLGTYSATDWYFPTQTAGTNWTGAINSINATFFLTGWTTITGLGNAPLTNGIYLTPDQDGRVYQRGTDGRATVTLSGVYFGVNALIQVLPVDHATGVSVGTWATLAASPTGGTFTGTISLPSRNGWYRFQFRKVISGIPLTDVVTTDLRIGVGEVVMLSGQSLMDHMSSTASGSDITANGKWSVSEGIKSLYNGIGREDIIITSVTNVGGQIQIGTQFAHGRRTGQRLMISAVVGTVEANTEWFITINGTNTFLLDGSVFTNAYISGGVIWHVQTRTKVVNNALHTVAGGHALIGNYASSQLGCPVMLFNRSVGGQSIEFFNSYEYASGLGGGAQLQILHAKAIGKVGAFIWLHGHQNVGQSGYHSNGGTIGAYTGWGSLGTLHNLLLSQMPNNDFSFAVAAFTSIGGTLAASSAGAIHNFRVGMKQWIDRRAIAGYKVFFAGWYNDRQPLWENSILPNAHMSVATYKRFAARLAHSYAWFRSAIANSSHGPKILSASRAGAVITLAVQQNGGTALRVLKFGAKPSGFEVSANNFTTKLPITSIAFPDATHIVITLASDPGAAVNVRYQFGMVGDYTSGVYFTPRITNATNNGSGAIRITCSLVTTDVTPNGSQAVGGHGLSDNDWIQIKDVGGTVEANDIWQVDVIDSSNFDLIGSTFTNAFVPTAGATPVVVRELGVPVYDDRTIGGYDTNGAPLAPTEVPVLAA